MIKNSTILGVFILSTLATVVYAENVAVEGDAAFIVDNAVPGSQLIVKKLSDGSVNSCLANANLNLEENKKATDIVINKGKAVITTHDSVTDSTDIKLVDVTSCIPNQVIPVEECITTVADGVLTIPCVQYNGEMLSVVLEQRGNSMNWELKSSPILNDTFKGHKGSHKGSSDSE